MIKLNFVFILCLVVLQVEAQDRFTISGKVNDAKTGEALIGVTIIIRELQATGTTTNAYGFYSITLARGSYTVIAQFVGYNSTAKSVAFENNQKIDFSLTEATQQLDEIVIKENREDHNIQKTEMGSEKLAVGDIAKIPVIMGEKDVLKTLQLLPGVKSAGEGSVGFFVRGGGSDQNLILFDEATIYNASHFLSFFSVFNSDALKDITLYKGSMPAEYGGRISSVLDIKMNDGNNQDLDVSGGLGLISSRLSVQGPLKKERSSFIISGRRTYADLFLNLSDDEALKSSKLYFYDLNAKLNYTLNDKNRVFLSGYFGQDQMAVRDIFGLFWGNQTATLRWNHLFNDRLFSNTSLIYSNYSYKVEENNGGNKLYTTSKIQDYNIKQDFQFFINSRSTFKFGLNSLYHTIVPGVLTSADGTKTTNLNLKRYSWENALYISHEITLGQVNLSYGLRASSFSILGPGDFYSLENNGSISDTVSYATRKILKTYWNMEPRISINYILSEQSSIKAAYTRTAQYLHLITSAAVSQPTDLWIPSSHYVKPEIGDQYSIGYFRNFADNTYEFSLETYYKHLQNQIDYKDGAQLELSNSIETELLFGKGRAYGVEFLLKKKKGRLTGWVGYTLSRTERQVREINNGKYYPARQDRTHDISIVALYDLSAKLTLSANWVYNTGNAVTFPSGKYSVDGQIVSYYAERNGYRMPAYHRLDLGLTWQRKKTAKFESSWTFSVYNAYARQNPFMINFRQSYQDPSRSEAVQLSLFSIVPAVTYNFKF